MELTAEHREYIRKSVLCWLATASTEGVPNVSPKEIFNYFGTDKIIIANIASPQTVKNIKENEKVCIGFIDILVQKGFQVKGTARIVGRYDPEFSEMQATLAQMTDGKFPFSTVTEIQVQKVKPIIAPRYLFYPETTEAQQIENARKTYGL